MRQLSFGDSGGYNFIFLCSLGPRVGLVCPKTLGSLWLCFFPPFCDQLRPSMKPLFLDTRTSLSNASVPRLVISAPWWSPTSAGRRHPRCWWCTLFPHQHPSISQKSALDLCVCPNSMCMSRCEKNGRIGVEINQICTVFGIHFPKFLKNPSEIITHATVPQHNTIHNNSTKQAQ